MKLKNIMNDVRQLRVKGQVVLVAPGKTIEVENAVYDDRVFEVIKLKRTEKVEQTTKLEEDK
jgi:hypothetical protein